MRMNLEVTESPELKVIIKNPDMTNFEIAADKATIDSTRFYFQLAQLQLDFNGTLENGLIKGEMQQHGMKWEVIFSREVQEKVVLKRPQEPKPPFNYTTDSLQIENGDIELGATLTLPQNFNASTPILILASGSGPQNRDNEITGHKSFWVIADHLARNNIATVRFDDRGTGSSTGVQEQANLMEFASDVEAVARYVRKHLKYKKNPLGILGHSEGGMHALIAANNFKKVDFHIQMATVGTNGKDVLIQQQYEIPKASGASEVLSEWNRTMYKDMCAIILKHPQDIATDSLTELLGDTYDNAPDDYDKRSTSRLQFILGNIVFMNNDWMRQFVQFEASEYLCKLEKKKVPLLAIHGGKDVQVSPEINSKGFSEYAYADLHIMEGLNHLMQSCNTCSYEEYGDLEETISPSVLNLITTWIQELP